MLAQNFMPPATLGLSDKEFEALVKVLGMFERGEVVHWSGHWDGKPCQIPNAFNMRLWSCGTAHCIGGWAGTIIGERTLQEKTSSRFTDGLSLLFYPRTNYLNFPMNHEITVDQAASALRNYLTTGQPNWDEATA